MTDDLEQIFRAHHASLCEFVNSIVRAPDIAEEIVQELFLAVWRNPSGLRQARSQRAYLYVAARNRALRHRRHDAIALRAADAADADREPLGSGPLPESPLEQMLHAEVVRALERAMALLPERTRLAMTLRRQGMSYAEVAEVMEISVKGVEKLLASAMRKLRETLPDGLR